MWNSRKLISNQMIKYQLPHTPLNQISNHKYDILNTQAAKFIFTKTERLKVTVWKNCQHFRRLKK